MMADAGSTSMTCENAAIDLGLFVAGFVILSCLAAAFTEGTQAALDMLARRMVVRESTKSGRPAEGAKIARAARRAHRPGAAGGVKEGANASMP